MDRSPKVPYHILILTLVTPIATALGRSSCDKAFSKCSCGPAPYLNETVFLVNCTDTQFTNTDALENLPAETEVLIFSGNRLYELPWNVFGTLRNYTKLRVVDMSNNNIHEILGKSYHHVANVERLILNYNKISISEDDRINHHHPRIFSNFINLRALHLTNAFAENSKNLATDLHDIFVNSNLTKLIKLHLEQNGIEKFDDREVFCDLPEIMDLHLANNRLNSIDLELSCMKKLRFIDLEGNQITHLTTNDMKNFDSVVKQNEHFMIDITDNPLSCECDFDKFVDWFANTKVEVRNSNRLRCHHNVTVENCLTESLPKEDDPSLAIGLILFTTLTLTILLLIIYQKRKSISYRFAPIVESVSKRVYYSSISHNDDQEIAV